MPRVGLQPIEKRNRPDYPIQPCLEILILLAGLEQFADHLGMLFVFFGLGLPVFPDGRGLIFSLCESPQQASPFIERPDG
ncbi:MAG TPA: hypothetical protein VFA77_03980 [Candidatus Eisenbacteria bacterium]|nr:hypothetical protein [Candidatus Eisenbacteria bacterium]